MYNVGNENLTIVHECLHWELHRNFFELQHLINSDEKAISCTAVDKYISNSKIAEEYNWMEWQANAISARILMPTKQTKEKFKEILNKVYNLNKQISMAELYSEAVKETAEFFGTTVSATKVRLIQLGVSQTVGTNAYIDGKLQPSYFLKNNAIKPGQTCVIDFMDAYNICLKNSKLGGLIFQHKIVYAEVFLVINFLNMLD